MGHMDYWTLQFTYKNKYILFPMKSNCNNSLYFTNNRAGIGCECKDNKP